MKRYRDTLLTLITLTAVAAGILLAAQSRTSRTTSASSGDPPEPIAAAGAVRAALQSEPAPTIEFEAYPYIPTPVATVTPDATAQAMSNPELAEAYISFIADEHLLRDPISVVHSADVYAKDAEALYLTADSVTFGGEPDLAVVYEGRSDAGDLYYRMIVLDRGHGVYHVRGTTDLPWLLSLLP